MSGRDIQLHHDDLYGYELLAVTILNMTNKVLELAKDSQNIALDKMYTIIFTIDGLNGFNESIQAIVHQIRSFLKFVSWKDRKLLSQKNMH